MCTVEKTSVKRSVASAFRRECVGGGDQLTVAGTVEVAAVHLIVAGPLNRGLDRKFGGRPDENVEGATKEQLITGAVGKLLTIENVELAT